LESKFQFGDYYKTTETNLKSRESMTCSTVADKCARCGSTDAVTTIHMDGDKSNNRWWNCLPLCFTCDASNVDWFYLWSGMPECPQWLAPYLAGHYGFHHIGEDFTRWEVDILLEELIRIGWEENCKNYLGPIEVPDEEVTLV